MPPEAWEAFLLLNRERHARRAGCLSLVIPAVVLATLFVICCVEVLR